MMDKNRENFVSRSKENVATVVCYLYYNQLDLFPNMEIGT